MTGYDQLYRQYGCCPIEAGVVGKLADHECRHGRLPHDRTPSCGCFPQEPAPAKPVRLVPKPVKAPLTVTEILREIGEAA